MMMSCKKAAELTCQSLDRPLSRRERLKLWFHLAMCRQCAAFRRQCEGLEALFAKRFRNEIGDEEFQQGVGSLSAETCERMKQRLREAMEQ